MKNERIREIMNPNHNFMDIIEKKRYLCYSYLQRMKNTRWPKKIYERLPAERKNFEKPYERLPPERRKRRRPPRSRKKNFEKPVLQSASREKLGRLGNAEFEKV